MGYGSCDLYVNHLRQVFRSDRPRGESSMIKRLYHAVTRVSVWMLILVTAVPAPLLAQTQSGSGFPSLGGVGGVGPGSKDTLPGSPVVTNPTALQPLAPPQTPCPAPPAKTQPPIAPTGPTLNDFWPSDSSAVLPPSADTRIRLEREERGRLAQQAAQLTSKDYSVEEAFAQFSVLQNVKSRLHQFGYDFFDTQA